MPLFVQHRLPDSLTPYADRSAAPAAERSVAASVMLHAGLGNTGPDPSAPDRWARLCATHATLGDRPRRNSGYFSNYVVSFCEAVVFERRGSKYIVSTELVVTEGWAMSDSAIKLRSEAEDAFNTGIITFRMKALNQSEALSILGVDDDEMALAFS